MSDGGEESKEGNPWVALIIGILMMVGGWWLFSVFAAAEHTGQSMRINVIILGIYNIFGKWGVAGLLAVPGAFAVFSAIGALRKS